MGIWILILILLDYVCFACDLNFLGLILFFLLILLCIIAGKKVSEPPLRFGSIGQVRQYLYQQLNDRYVIYVLDFFLPGHSHYTRWDWDVDTMIAFDKQVSSGECTPLPKLRTRRGQELFSEYIRLLEKARTESLSTEEKQQIIDQGGWHCRCGRYNPAYTATCVCGKNKRDIPANVKQSIPEIQSWRCTCGRENPSYTSTCVCGESKHKQ